jgi:MFS family permease
MFFAYFISFTGTAMAPIAMAFGILELTGSTKDTAFVIATPTFASILVLILGGVIADRSSRQKVIISAEGSAMVVQLIIATLFLTGNASISAMIFLMLINGVTVAFNAPAATGFITQLVDKQDLQGTNALLGIARNIALIVGAALGGLLVAFIGAGWTILIDAISFGISSLLVYSIIPKEQVKHQPESIVKELVSGWKEFTQHKWIWVIVLQFAFVVAGIDAFMGLLGPSVAKDYLNGPSDWGLIAGAVGLGTLIGGLIAFKLKVKYPMRLATLCVLFFSFPPLAMAISLPFYLIILSAILAGLGIQIFSVIWFTTLQTKIPPEMLSRVCAYDHIGSISLAPLGIVVSGFLYEYFGYQIVLILSSLIIIVPTLLVLLVKDVWKMPADNTFI